MLRYILLAALFLPSLSVAQSQFVGKWQTKTNAAGKSTITVDIVVDNSVVGGNLVFLDNHGEFKMSIVKAHASGDVLEFETKGDHGDAWSWRLTLKGTRKGLLHGSIGEMLIDERVKKTR